ncbi:hypothetical protein ACKKBG_A22780 [Auxenochlorella protothecoides x Auxenochlorella symbiontica]
MDEASDFGAGERVPKLDLSTVDLGTSLQQALGRADAVLMELKTLRSVYGIPTPRDGDGAGPSLKQAFSSPTKGGRAGPRPAPTVPPTSGEWRIPALSGAEIQDLAPLEPAPTPSQPLHTPWHPSADLARALDSLSLQDEPASGPAERQEPVAAPPLPEVLTARKQRYPVRQSLAQQRLQAEKKSALAAKQLDLEAERRRLVAKMESCRAHAAKPKVAPQRNQVFHPKPPVAKPAIPSNSTPAKRKAPPGEATNAPPLRATRFVMAQAAERSDGGRPGPNPRLRHAQTAPPPGTRGGVSRAGAPGSRLPQAPARPRPLEVPASNGGAALAAPETRAGDGGPAPGGERLARTPPGGACAPISGAPHADAGGADACAGAGDGDAQDPDSPMAHAGRPPFLAPGPDAALADPSRHARPPLGPLVTGLELPSTSAWLAADGSDPTLHPTPSNIGASRAALPRGGPAARPQEARPVPLGASPDWAAALLAVGGGRREAAEALRAMTARGARVWKRWARTAGMSKGSSRRLRLRVGDGGVRPHQLQVGYRRGWFRSARWFGIDGVLVPRDSNWPSLLLRTSEGVLQADFESEAAQAAALVALAAGLAAAPAGAPLAEVPCPPAIRFLPPAT